MPVRVGEEVQKVLRRGEGEWSRVGTQFLYPFVSTFAKFDPDYFPSTLEKWKWAHCAKRKRGRHFSIIFGKNKPLDSSLPVALPAIIR